MGDVGWFLAVTALIVVLLGGGFLVSVFAWFAKHDGDVKVQKRPVSSTGMAGPIAGLVILAGLLAGIIRLLRPYLH